ncbi:MAG: peptidoglycan-binding protein, partial [Gammaproteobacteria bacterium]|nr:peptidoglycan-binding protein [Gammaproteobacteria bacterium]
TRGSRGDLVVWLRESLAAIAPEYASEDTQSDTFDEGLGQVVRQFQRDHRLSVDGVAGQQTQIIINSLLAGDGTPRLNTPRLALD